MGSLQFENLGNNSTKTTLEALVSAINLWNKGHQAVFNFNCRGGLAWVNFSAFLGNADLKDGKDEEIKINVNDVKKKKQPSPSKQKRSAIRAAKFRERNDKNKGENDQKEAAKEEDERGKDTEEDEEKEDISFRSPTLVNSPKAESSTRFVYKNMSKKKPNAAQCRKENLFEKPNALDCFDRMENLLEKPNSDNSAGQSFQNSTGEYFAKLKSYAENSVDDSDSKAENSADDSDSKAISKRRKRLHPYDNDGNYRGGGAYYPPAMSGETLEQYAQRVLPNTSNTNCTKEELEELSKHRVAVENKENYLKLQEGLKLKAEESDIIDKIFAEAPWFFWNPSQKGLNKVLEDPSVVPITLDEEKAAYKELVNLYNTERDSVDSMTAVDEYYRNYESDFLDSGRKKFRRKLEFVEGYALVYRVAAGKYQQRIVDLKRKLEALECNGYNMD